MSASSAKKYHILIEHPVKKHIGIDAKFRLANEVTDRVGDLSELPFMGNKTKLSEGWDITPVG